MRCALCHRLSLQILCKTCLSWLDIEPRVRKIGNLRILSAFSYEDAQMLLKSKYTLLGSRILWLLAQKAARYYAATGLLKGDFRGVGLDDMPRGGYSHTAIIARAFCKYAQIRALYGRIYARNLVRYAGKSLDFRRKNPRKFTTTLTPKIAGDGIILFDDTIVTGTTLCEAAGVLEKKGIPVFCALTLASTDSSSPIDIDIKP